MSSKISALTALTAASVDGSADVLPIYDVSADSDKKQTVNELAIAMGGKAGTEQSLSSNRVTFSSVPTWAKRIVVNVVGASVSSIALSGAIVLEFQDDDGNDLSCYGSARNAAGSVTLFQDIGTAVTLVYASATASVWECSAHIVMENAISGSIAYSARTMSSTSNAATDVYMSSGRIAGGTKQISSIVVSTAGGTSFDAGVANVRYYR